MENDIVKQMQKISYGILCYIDDFCKENDINYYLSGGSCLGAVRHKGFIPWDDDVDIMMPRPDYEKFIKVFADKGDKKYAIGSLDTNEKWVRTYARVWRTDTKLTQKILKEEDMGLFVDIFPIDGLPDLKFGQFLFYRKIRLLNIFRYESLRQGFYEGERLQRTKKLLSSFMKKFDARKMSFRLEKCAKKYAFMNSRYVAVSMAVHYFDKETVPYEAMAEPVYMRFEDREFPIPCGYDVYLKALYGDYMQIPKDKKLHLEGWDVSLSEYEE